MALSLLMIFLYGSLIWGIVPWQTKISWESHLLGAVAGFIIAFFLRKEGPQREVYDWENEPDEDPVYIPPSPEIRTNTEPTIRYLYKPNDPPLEN